MRFGRDGRPRRRSKPASYFAVWKHSSIARPTRAGGGLDRGRTPVAVPAYDQDPERGVRPHCLGLLFLHQVGDHVGEARACLVLDGGARAVAVAESRTGARRAASRGGPEV